MSGLIEHCQASDIIDRAILQEALESVVISETSSVVHDRETLRKYFANPTTTDLAYSLLLKILENTPQISEDSLRRTLSLLRANMLRQLPSRPLLQQLADFFKMEPKDQELSNSFKFMQRLTTKWLERSPAAVPAVAITETVNESPRPFTRASSRINPRRAHVRSWSGEHSEFIPTDFLAVRVRRQAVIELSFASLFDPAAAVKPGDAWTPPGEAILQSGVRTVTKELRRSGVYLRVVPPVQQMVPYRQQEPLVLPLEEAQALLGEALCSPSYGRYHAGVCLLGKLVMDSFIAGHPVEALTSFCLQLLFDSKMTERVIEVLFNLSVHVHCLESQISGSSGGDAIKFQQRLWKLTLPWLERLAGSKSSDPALWSNVLNLLVYFCSERGRLSRAMAAEIPLSVLSALSDLPDLEVRTELSLVRLIVNALYLDDLLDTKRVDGFGLARILDLLLRVTCVESRRNLFLVVFDLAMSQVTRKNICDMQHSPELLFLLTSTQFPDFLPELLLHCPKDFPARFTKAILGLDQVVWKDNKKLLRLVTAQGELLDCFLVELSKICSDFPKLAGQTAGPQSFALSFRREPPQPSEVEAWVKAGDTVRLHGLVRSYFVELLEAKDGPLGQTAAFKQLNERLLGVVDLLSPLPLRWLLRLLFSVLCSWPAIPAYDWQTPDYQLYTKGMLKIRGSLLSLLDLKIFKTIFERAGTPESQTISLCCILQVCYEDRSNLEKIDPFRAFFRDLLRHPNPTVSYLACGFIMSQLAQEEPAQYREVLAHLLAKAREMDDENILTNPYLQVKLFLQL